MLTVLEEKLTDKLYAIGAIKFDFDPDLSKRFPLKIHEAHPEWPKSPVYLNLRDANHPVPEKRGELDDETFEMIGEVFRPFLLVQRELTGVDFVADIPDAGTPFGNQVIRVLNMSDVIRLRLTKINLPNGQRRIGPVVEVIEPVGGLVILVDDLVMGADTKREAVAQLRAAGYIVVLILVLVDREAGGIEQLRAEGINIVAVMTLSDMLGYLVRTGKITEEMEAEILDYPRVIKQLQSV